MTTEPHFDETDQILESLRPRMRTARVGHVRRLIGGIALVPLLGAGAVAMASNGDGGSVTETAGVDDLASDLDIDLPDIGTADGDKAAAQDGDHEGGGDEPEVATTTTTTEAPEPETFWELSLGALGGASVEETDEGELVLVESDFGDGWEIVGTEIVDGALKITITDGVVMKVITIKPGLRDEISISIIDIAIPTTTTEKPAPAPTTTHAPVVDRIVVDVSGKGTFVVEREGDDLWAGNVQPAEGYDGTEVRSDGGKVWVGFTNGQHIWYGRVHIGEDGALKQTFWDGPIVEEEPEIEPTYRWAEVPGVGAVQFKLWEGLITVSNHETAEGFGFYDYNGGAAAEVGKIDFEGPGTLWIIEAWGTESGEIAIETSNPVSPE